jgi:hypothetical protein
MKDKNKYSKETSLTPLATLRHGLLVLFALIFLMAEPILPAGGYPPETPLELCCWNLSPTHPLTLGVLGLVFRPDSSNPLCGVPVKGTDGRMKECPLDMPGTPKVKGIIAHYNPTISDWGLWALPGAQGHPGPGFQKKRSVPLGIATQSFSSGPSRGHQKPWGPPAPPPLLSDAPATKGHLWISY